MTLVKGHEAIKLVWYVTDHLFSLISIITLSASFWPIGKVDLYNTCQKMYLGDFQGYAMLTPSLLKSMSLDGCDSA